MNGVTTHIHNANQYHAARGGDTPSCYGEQIARLHKQAATRIVNGTWRRACEGDASRPGKEDSSEFSRLALSVAVSPGLCPESTRSSPPPSA